MKEMFNEIQQLLSTPVPFSEIFEKRVPLPALLEKEVKFAINTEKISSYIKSLSESAYKRPLKNDAGSSAPTTFSIEGPLHRGDETMYGLQGKDMTISPDAWVFGELRVGARARISGVIRRNGIHYATKVTIVE